MSRKLYIRIFFEDANGIYQNGSQDFEPEDFGGVPAVGDVILSPFRPLINDNYEKYKGFWEVVKHYFKPQESNEFSYVALVVRERSRSSHEVEI